MPSFKLKETNASSIVFGISAGSSVAIVKGQLVTSASADASNLLAIQGAYKRMNSDGIITVQSPTTSDNDSAIGVLGALGCSVCSMSTEMSLLPSQTDTDIVENENIFDNSVFKLTAENTPATDKFPNSDTDPFFTLDDAPPKTLRNKISRMAATETTSDVVQITADLVSLNISREDSTLKQFG